MIRAPFCAPFLAVALAATGAHAAGLADVINGLRVTGARCAAATGLVPLTPRPALDRVAASVAGGAPLAESLKEAGYRMTSVQAIGLSETLEGAAVEKLISANYCAAVTDPKLVDIGVYQQGTKAWIVMAAPFAPSVDFTQAEAGARMLTLANQARAEPRRCGGVAFGRVPPLVWNAILAKAARTHAEDMARLNYFSHEARDGSMPAARVTRAGYRYRAVGENIAGGQTTPEGAVAGWLRSPPHCAALMSPVFTEMGAAFAANVSSDMGVYWTQLFGAPLD